MIKRAWPVWLLYLFFSVPTVFLAMWIEFQNCPRGLPYIEVPLVAIPAVVLGFLCGKLRAKRVFWGGCALNFLSSLVCIAVASLGQAYCPRNHTWSQFSPVSTALEVLVFLSLLATWVSWLFFMLGGGEKPTVKS